jgi:pimeloyl-ACP methyl ester carboxylesterase
MSRLDQLHNFLFDRLLKFQSDDLITHYGDEMRLVFRNELDRARREGTHEVLFVWWKVIRETVVLPAPRCLERAQLVFAATTLASALTLGTALGFCTVGSSSIVHACSQEQPVSQTPSSQRAPGHLVELSSGQHMFLECSGNQDAVPIVILATGRGLGTADAWAKVQERVSPTIRVCSYDALGAGRSDHLPNDAPPQRRPIDKVISDAHTFFEAAHLKQPYVLVGASDGGILLRRYQQAYPHEIAGLVFVDSAHEEQEWRMATISNQLDANWNDPVFQRDNGYLPDHQKLAWHADIPLIVLERTEKAPASVFPMLSPQQLDALNAEWHDHQVDLAKRSRYGQLIAVTGSGHFMHQQKPDAVAKAILDVVQQVRAKTR